MEKNIYPAVPLIGGVPDSPPTYNETVHPASAPMPPMPIHGGGQPLQQPFVQPQMVYIQQGPQVGPLGPRPCVVTCPSCHEQKTTKVRYETSTKTHLFAAVICVLGFFCCACIPYCMDTCKNPNHYCANCNAYLGTYK